MKNKQIILGIYINDRQQEAGEVQQLLSKFGKIIKTRIGLHNTDAGYDNPGGLILIEITGSETEQTTLETELGRYQGIELKKMTFNE